MSKRICTFSVPGFHVYLSACGGGFTLLHFELGDLVYSHWHEEAGAAMRDFARIVEAKSHAIVQHTRHNQEQSA